MYFVFVCCCVKDPHLISFFLPRLTSDLTQIMIGMRCVHCCFTMSRLCPSPQPYLSYHILIVINCLYIYFSVRDTISLHQPMGFVVYGGSALPRLVLHSTRSTETLLRVQNLALHVETPLQKFSTLHTTKSGSLV